MRTVLSEISDTKQRVRNTVQSTFHGIMLMIYISEQRLPQTWKTAAVVPIPKEQKVEDISKHLLPISLTPSMEEAEDFVVSSHFGPAVLEVIDPDQLGAMPTSSTKLRPRRLCFFSGLKPRTARVQLCE